MELGPEDVSLLERCLHFRGCYVHASMELGPEDVSLLCPHICMYYVQAMELGPKVLHTFALHLHILTHQWSVLSLPVQHCQTLDYTASKRTNQYMILVCVALPLSVNLAVDALKHS